MCNEIKKKEEEYYKGKYKVAMVQSISRGSLSTVPSVVFTPEVLKQYFGENGIPLLTSNDPKEIYTFVVKNALKNKIYKYNLQNNSSTMINFINYIDEKKRTSPTARRLLNKCTFCCTNSNANKVRELNIKKNTGIFFCLSSLRSVLSNYDGLPEYKTFLVASSSKNIFYDQVFNMDIKPKCRSNELKANAINEFINRGGYKLFLSLSTREEYNMVISEINKTTFAGEIVFLELDYPGEIEKLSNKNIVVSTVCSGVGVIGERSQYQNLNEYLPYDTCAVILCKNEKSWSSFIDSGVMWSNNNDDEETETSKQSMANNSKPRKKIKKPVDAGTITQSVP